MNQVRLGCFQEALKYEKLGFSVIPVKQDKQPLVRWEKFQKERAGETQIKEWFKQFPNANIGVVTGEISGIVVIDVEKGGKIDGLPPTVCSQTGGGGWHLFYKHPGKQINTFIRITELTDIKGNGSYVVMPPSVHKSGNKYEWLVSPENADFADLPPWLLGQMASNEGKKKNREGKLAIEILQGERNMTAAKLAGKLLRHLPVELWELSGWPAVKDWNQKYCKPPLEEEELRVAWESIKKAEAKQRQAKEDNGEGESSNKSKTKQLLKIVEKQNGINLFHDEKGDGYAQIRNTGGFLEIHKIRSDDFKRYLSYLMWKETNDAIYGEALASVTATLEGKAKFDGEMHELNIRSTWHEGSLWYDLGDWRAVKIDQNGWKIVPEPPILFKHLPHQKKQVEPVRGGNLRDILSFVNLKKDKGYSLLFLSYLAAVLIPDIPRAIQVLFGDAGSAKSTFQKVIKSLIDPSIMELQTFPQAEQHLIEMLDQHFVVYFDNISSLPKWLSDALARACTGESYQKRKLYTDDESVIFHCKKAMGLNGINMVPTEPDLLDRCLIFELEAISDNQRKSEQDFWNSFEKMKPKLLGALFDNLSKAISLKGHINLKEKPRLADYASWCAASVNALGENVDDLIAAFNLNTQTQNSEAIETNPTAQLIVEFMRELELGRWSGGASELLERLVKLDERRKLHLAKDRNFPKAPSVVWKRIKTVKANLQRIGILATYDTSSRPRKIILEDLRKSSGAPVIAGNKPNLQGNSLPAEQPVLFPPAGTGKPLENKDSASTASNVSTTREKAEISFSDKREYVDYLWDNDQMIDTDEKLEIFKSLPDL